MTLRIRYAFAGALLSACTLARADAPPTDYSDLWWNPAQNGWGLALQRQGDVMFAALYVYDAAGEPTWFVASDVRPVAGAADRWTGALYRVSGPSLAGTPDGNVVVAQAGTLAVAFDDARTGRIDYAVDGASVSSRIERQTWRTPSVAGSYHGGLSTLASACGDPNMNGQFQFTGATSIAEAGAATTLRIVSTSLAGFASTCTFTGTRAQAGGLGALEGTFSCAIYTGTDVRGENPSVVRRLGTFRLDRLAVSTDGFSGTLAASDQDCGYAGYLGGVKLP